MLRRHDPFAERLDGFPPGSLPRGIAPLIDAETPWSTGPDVRRAAVFLLFIPPAPPAGGAPPSAARLVFTRRSTQVRSHRGQISFPGGRADPDDLSPGATARRELSEEIGIETARVTTLGALPPVVSLDGSIVHPVVGAAAVDLADLSPSPAEVELLFADPWSLFAAGAGRDFQFTIFGQRRHSRVFEGGTCPVWGLTAQILFAAALGT